MRLPWIDSFARPQEVVHELEVLVALHAGERLPGRRAVGLVSVEGGGVARHGLRPVRMAAADLRPVADTRYRLRLARDARLIVAHVGVALGLLRAGGKLLVFAALRVEQDEHAQVVAYVVADVDAERLPKAEVDDRLEPGESLSWLPGSRVVARRARVPCAPVLLDRAVSVVHGEEELAQRPRETLLPRRVACGRQRLGCAPELADLLVARVDGVDAGLAGAPERAQHGARRARERLGLDEEAAQVGRGAAEIDERRDHVVGELTEAVHGRAQLT